MSLFKHHDDERQSAEFMGLVLDAAGLHTPAGLMPLADITRAEFLRDIVSAGHGSDEMSAPAVVGGAAVGAVAFGAIGAVAGGYLGSTVKEEGPEQFKTQSVHLIFATDSLDYSLPIPREQEGGAITFADTVKHAVKHAKG
jgi:hypothetical protein